MAWESLGKGYMREVVIPTDVSIFPKEIFQSSKRLVRSRCETSSIIVSLKLVDILLRSSSRMCLLMKCARVLPP